MSSVLDSSAVIAYLMQEPGGDVTEWYIDAGGCFVHIVNVCEVLYYLRRHRTREDAERGIQELDTLGVGTRYDSDLPFPHIVADYL